MNAVTPRKAKLSLSSYGVSMGRGTTSRSRFKISPRQVLTSRASSPLGDIGGSGDDGDERAHRRGVSVTPLIESLD